MLINCPKCGFSQPQDQYCAQCGVDMLQYKPKSIGLMKKLFQHVGVQLFILLLVAGYIGQSLIRGEKPQQWVQKITHFQGITKSVRMKEAVNFSNDEDASVQSGRSGYVSGAEKVKTLNENQNLKSLSDSEIATAKNESFASSAAASTSTNLSSLSSTDAAAINMKLTYAEVSSETLAKWIAESSNLGLYQTLTDYSAGILNDYRRRTDPIQQVLKSTTIKLNLGSANSNLSGTMTEDGSHLIGLVTAIEYKSNENDTTHGTISISRNTNQGNEVFPAEFDLPRGAAFFIVGVLKPDSFAADKGKLIMPPFQVLKSPDFVAHKTEFVIILEPELK